jgi:hypothetical protein
LALGSGGACLHRRRAPRRAAQPRGTAALVAAPNDVAAAQPCTTVAAPDRVPQRKGGIEERMGGARVEGARPVSRPGEKGPATAADGCGLRDWEKGLGIRVE